MDDAVSPGALSSRRTLLVACGALLLLVVTLWAYAPVLDNAFVWDDGANLVAARSSWGTGFEGVRWSFTTPFFGHYQPLTWLSYRVDLALSGATPRGVHATNLALHLVASALVGLLAAGFTARASRQNGPAGDPRTFALVAGLVAAALFALHPVHVESVAWATERRDLLSTAFVLAAVLVHLTTSPPDLRPSPARGWIAGLHLLAALSRAQMSLPFVLLALDLWPLGRLRAARSAREGWSRLVAEKALSLAIAAASAVTALWAQASSGALTAASEHGLLDRIVQTGYSLAFYPSALLFRTTFLPLYERPSPFPSLAAEYLAPAVATLVALVAIGLLRPRLPALATATVTYVLFVLPVAGPAQSGIQLVADRYAYLATVPLLLLLVCGSLSLIARSGRRTAVWAGLGVLLLALAGATVTTRRQTLVWRDDASLWRHVLAHSSSVLADNNFGQILLARGESGEALRHLVRALEKAPTYPRPWRALAAILEAPWPQGGPDRAWVAATLDRAAALSPGLAVPAYASGLAWLRAGDAVRAQRQFRRTLLLEPGHEGARLALSRLLEPSEARPATSARATPTPP